MFLIIFCIFADSSYIINNRPKINDMDTILTDRDTITQTVVKATDSCQQIFKETMTNWHDVIIVAIICITLIVIAFILKCGLLKWQEKKLDKQKESDDAKRLYELEKIIMDVALKEVAEDNKYCRRNINNVVEADLKNEAKLSTYGTRSFFTKIMEFIVKFKNCLQ